MPLADHCAHEAVYVRNEGTAVVRALPPSTRDTLRYFEMVSVLERFQPLAPLHGATINPQGWYQVVVSDWSLMVLSQSGGSKDAVLLEVPLLSIQDMDVQYKDSGELLDEQPAQQRKTAVITVIPQVALHKLPPDMKDKLRRVQQVLDRGGEPPAAYAAAAGPGCCQADNTISAAATSPAVSTAGQQQQQQYSSQQYMRAQQQYMPSQQPYVAQQGYMPSQQPYAVQQPSAMQPGQQQQYMYQQQGMRRGPGPVGESIEGPFHAAPAQPTYTASQPLYPQQPQYVHQGYGPYPNGFTQPQACAQPYQQMQCVQPPSPTANGWSPIGMPLAQQQWPQQQQHMPDQSQYGMAMPPTPASPARRARAPPPASPPHPTTPGMYTPHRYSTSPYSPYNYHPASPGFPLTPPATAASRPAPPPPLDLRAPVLLRVEQPTAGSTWEPEGAEADASDYVLEGYRLVLMTMEPHSLLWFHLRRAWLGAHARYAAVAAGRHGTPLWYAPPNMYVPQPPGLPGPHLLPLSDLPPRAAAAALLERLGYTREGRVVLQGLYPWDQLNRPLGSAGDGSTCTMDETGIQVHTTYTFTGAGQLEIVQPTAACALPAAQQYGQQYSVPQQHAQQYSVQQQQYGSPPQALIERAVNEPSEREVREVFEAAERRLACGCSLFDDDDVAVLKALVLEMSAASAPKARAYARHFFRSRTVAAFCLARVYAWGTVCALWAPARTQAASSTRPTPPTDSYVNPTSSHNVAPAFQNTYIREQAGRPASMGTPSGRASVGGSPAARMAPSTPPASAPSAVSSSSPSPPPSSRLTPYVSWVLSKGQKKREAWSDGTRMPMASAAGTPMSPWTSVLHATAQSAATPSPWGSPTRHIPSGGTPMPVYSAPAGPPSPARANRHYAAASAILSAVPSTRPSTAASAYGAATPAQAPLSSVSGLGGTSSWPSAGGAAAGAGATRHASFAGVAQPGEGTESVSDDERDPGYASHQTRRSLYSALSVSIPDDPLRPGMRQAGQSPYFGAASSQGGMSILDPRHPLAPPSARGLPPRHRPPLTDPDKLSGTSKTADEEAYELYLSLYNARCWGGWGAGGGVSGVWGGIEGGGQLSAHARRLLKRLGLDPSGTTSINDTLATVMDLVEVRHRPSDLKSNFCGRSKPPTVPAPPTLCPEPLCLSPLAEGPYLFVQGGPIEGTAASQGQGSSSATGMQAVVSAEAGGVAAAALARAQARAQARTAGSSLAAVFLENYYGGAGGGASAGQTAAVKRWERLMGRLCAACAWRKAMALTHILSLVLEQSEGVAGRDGWLGEGVIEAQPEDEDEENGCGEEGVVGGRGVWTFKRATQHLVAAVVQLRDPWGDATHRAVAAWTPAPLASRPGGISGGAGLASGAGTWTSPPAAAGQWSQASGSMYQPPGAMSASGSAAAASPHTAAACALGTGCPGDPLWWAAGEGRAGRAGAAPLDAIAGVCWGVWQLGEQASSRGGACSGYAGVVVEVLKQVPPRITHAFLRRLLCRATCLLAAGPDAGCGGHEADAVAFRECELLLSLLNGLPGAADAIHDALMPHLTHTLRTPAVSSALAARSRGRALHTHSPCHEPRHVHHGRADPGSCVLPGLAVGMYGQVVGEVLGARMETRPASMWTSGLSQAMVHSMASTAHYKMPGALT